MVFKIIDSPAKADELQLAGLLWWRKRGDDVYKPDDPEVYGEPSETWGHHDFAILIEE